MSAVVTEYNEKLVINRLRELNQIWKTTKNTEKKTLAEKQILNITNNELLILRIDLISNKTLYIFSALIVFFSVVVGLFLNEALSTLFQISSNPIFLILAIDIPLYGILLFRYYTLRSLFSAYDLITAGKKTYFTT